MSGVPSDTWRAAEEALQRRVAARAGAFRSLRSAADGVAVVGWIVGIGGLVAGIALAFVTETEGLLDERHPYVGVGVVVVVVSVAVGLLMVLLACWARAWMRCNE